MQVSGGSAVADCDSVRAGAFGGLQARFRILVLVKYLIRKDRLVILCERKSYFSLLRAA
jgi:hypothetical protein